MVGGSFFEFFGSEELVLAALVLPKLVVFIICDVVNSTLLGGFNNSDSCAPVMCMGSVPSSVGGLFGTDSLGLSGGSCGSDSVSTVGSGVAGGSTSLLVVFPSGFSSIIGGCSMGSKLPTPGVSVCCYSIGASSDGTCDVVTALLSKCSGDLDGGFGVGFNSGCSLSASGSTANAVFSVVLPFLVLAFLFDTYVSMTPSTVTKSGSEKAVTALLIAPVGHDSLTVKGVVDLDIVTVLDTLDDFIKAVTSLPGLVNTSESSKSVVDTGVCAFASCVFILLVVLAAILMMVDLVTVLSTVTGDMGSTDAVVSPLVVVAVLMKVASVFNSISSGEILCLVPVFGDIRTVKKVFSFGTSMMTVLVALVDGIYCSIVLICVLAEMFGGSGVVFSGWLILGRVSAVVYSFLGGVVLGGDGGVIVV